MLRRLKAYRLALEWSPHDGAIPNCEFSETSSRQDATLGDIKCIHDNDDVIISGASAFDVLDELGGYEFLHVPSKVGWMQGDPALHIVKEEHGDGMWKKGWHAFEKRGEGDSGGGGGLGRE